jgi:hypothetical protein
MKRRRKLRHEFVELAPAKLKDGVVYVSVKYATVIHKCCCGCGNKVVTPLSPTDWQLTFNGETISLYPSIGNWAFPCHSHYWIINNRVQWARKWTEEEIAQGRHKDQLQKERFYSRK